MGKGIRDVKDTFPLGQSVLLLWNILDVLFDASLSSYSKGSLNPWSSVTSSDENESKIFILKLNLRFVGNWHLHWKIVCGMNRIEDITGYC